MRLLVMTFLAGLLLAAPTVVLVEQNVVNLTPAIDYSDHGFTKKAIFKGNQVPC